MYFCNGLYCQGAEEEEGVARVVQKRPSGGGGGEGGGGGWLRRCRWYLALAIQDAAFKQQATDPQTDSRVPYWLRSRWGPQNTRREHVQTVSQN